MFLSSFTLPSRSDEDGFILGYPPELEMACYEVNNAYPFKLFPDKGLSQIALAPLTVIYGTNGSGKSTLLNVIAQKLQLSRSSRFNNSPCMDAYLELCDYEVAPRVKKIPRLSRIITSDDVFDFLLDLREKNVAIANRRDELFTEYDELNETKYADRPFRSMEDYEDLKRRGEAKRSSRSQYVSRRVPKEMVCKSNGESAFLYFTQKIEDNALYLLDEPENSLSASLQMRLAEFIEESVRFYGCQFIISTHSPFLLSLKGAKIYDLDSTPVCERSWTELENVRAYFDLFDKHRDQFK